MLSVAICKQHHYNGLRGMDTSMSSTYCSSTERIHHCAMHRVSIRFISLHIRQASWLYSTSYFSQRFRLTRRIRTDIPHSCGQLGKVSGIGTRVRRGGAKASAFRGRHLNRHPAASRSVDRCDRQHTPHSASLGINKGFPSVHPTSRCRRGRS